MYKCMITELALNEFTGSYHIIVNKIIILRRKIDPHSKLKLTGTIPSNSSILQLDGANVVLGTVSTCIYV